MFEQARRLVTDAEQEKAIRTMQSNFQAERKPTTSSTIHPYHPCCLVSCLPDHHQAWCYPNSAVTVLTTSISISSCKCCHFYIIFIYHQSVTLAYLEQLYLMFCSHNLPADYEHQELAFNVFQSCQWLVALYHLFKLNRVMREMLFTTSNVQYVLH